MTKMLMNSNRWFYTMSVAILYGRLPFSLFACSVSSELKRVVTVQDRELVQVYLNHTE